MEKKLFFLSLIIAALSGACAPPPSSDKTTVQRKDLGAPKPKPGEANPADVKAKKDKENAAFHAEVEKALALLQTTETGKSIVEDVKKMKADGSLSSIVVDPSEALKKFGTHFAGIRQIGTESKYDIVFYAEPADLQTLAHGIGHELTHIKIELQEDQFFAQNKDFDKRLKQASDAAQSGKAKEFIDGGGSKAIQMFLYTLYFHEVNAYKVDEALIKEGIPFQNDTFARLGVVRYVIESYTPKGLDLGISPDNLDSLISKYTSLPDFQKDLITKNGSI